MALCRGAWSLKAQKSLLALPPVIPVGLHWGSRLRVLKVWVRNV